MHMLLRFLYAMLVRGARAPRLQIGDVSRIDHRVQLVDIDLLGHMNNGRYLSFMDLGRIDLTKRAGMAAHLSKAHIHAVVGQQSIAYRRSIGFLQRFTLESRLVGADERSVYVEQRFVAKGEVMARAVVRGRFIQRGVGAVRMSVVSEACGYDFEANHPVPDDIRTWADWSSLPGARAEHPSVWA
ncbi:MULTISPECIES: acyl-CoA thioesterase [unclassified Agrococcus]|uniref:acyl-CoA thioesterase n=1 Tax=unclassified Agrococcus TaxID=2615065 RepID=UPI0036112CDF